MDTLNGKAVEQRHGFRGTLRKAHFEAQVRGELGSVLLLFTDSAETL